MAEDIITSSENENNKKDKKNNIITAVCVAVSSAIILGCASYFAVPALKDKKADTKKENSNSITTREYANPFLANLSTSYYDTIEPDNFNQKFKKLYSLNPDTIGWLSIPNLNIDRVILFKPEDKANSYYLHKDMFGQYYKHGCAYADYRCSFDKDSFAKNTVIYGHDIPLVFANLDEYRTIEGYQNSPVITFNTIYGEYKWKVFAAFTTTAYPEGDNGYNFVYFYPKMADEKTPGFLAEIKKRAFYFTNVDVQSTDKFLTLSTCCYDYASSYQPANWEKGRLVVIARLIRNGESDTVDTSNIKLNTNRYEPQAYYTKHGKTNPWKTSTWSPF